MLILFGLLAQRSAGAATHQDPKALAVVEALEKTVAPDNGWSKVGGLRFTFSVIEDGAPQNVVHHSWNVSTGQYRVDWTQDGGQRMAIFNVGAKGKQGEAYIRLGTATTTESAAQTSQEGKPAKKPRADMAEWSRTPPVLERQILAASYDRFLNETYWLLMPLKMRDPGVNLDYDGEKKIDRQIYDVLKLTFENVGLTPGDTYWAYVNRETHLIDRWEYILEDGAPRPDDRAVEKDNELSDGEKGKTEPAASKSASPASPVRSVWIWKDWQSYGPVKLATTKTMPNRSLSIVLKNIEVLSSMPESEFQPPTKPLVPHVKPAAATKTK